MRLIECYDVGGTNIRGALIEYGSKKIIKSESHKTVRRDSNRFVEQIIDMSVSLRNSISSSQIDILAVSLGLPGPVKNGILLESPPLGFHSKLDISTELKKEIKETIYVDNDLNVAARAELHLGVGKTVKNFYLLTISTGIGVGIVLNGKIIHGTCGEFGHSVLERDSNKANKCSCGRTGCWVAMASGYGIESTIKNKLKNNMTVENLFEIYNEGDKNAKEIIDMARDYNAHGIGNMLNAFQVDEIVVMGSIGLNQFDRIIPSPEEIKKYTINEVPEIQPTSLGSNIGLLGAYILACEKPDEK